MLSNAVSADGRDGPVQWLGGGNHSNERVLHCLITNIAPACSWHNATLASAPLIAGSLIPTMLTQTNRSVLGSHVSPKHVTHMR